MTAAAPTVGRLLAHWEIGSGLWIPVTVALVYVAAAARTSWSLLRTVSFVAGCGALAVALASGLGSEDDSLLSIHMAQHIVLTTFAAPLLVAGAPVTLLIRNVRGRRRRAVVVLLHSPAGRWLTHPVVGLVLFSAVELAAHVPAVYEAALAHPLVHGLEHAAFLWSALLFWTPLIGADPVPHHPGFLTRLSVLLATMPVMAVVSITLNSATTVLYPSYRAGAAALGVDALADQRTAAGLMTVMGMTTTALIALAVAGDALYKEERRAQARELHAAIAEREGRLG